MIYQRYCATALAVLLSFLNVAAAQHVDGYGDKIGTVSFPVTGKQLAATRVERGVALLHHMMYASADRVFAEAIEADSDCAMAYWGRAMTLIHPIWPDTPNDEMLRKGSELVKEAKVRGRKTIREQAYIGTVDAYFRNGTERDEGSRLASFEDAWKRVYENHPRDIEAAAFYALAHMATASTTDKTYKQQRRAGEIATHILEQVPDHPGGHHYLIHAYDFPPLAEMALPVARNYGKIAPNVPHALHMPTHIFTRRGLWQESIDWNIRSAYAAWKMGVNDGGISVHYMHALDYLAYAYLQGAEDKKANAVVELTRSIEWKQLESNLAGAAYAFASIPARLQLERQDWSKAAKVTPREPKEFPWGDKFAQFEAISHFSRALGAARSGDKESSRAALTELNKLQAKSQKNSPYWGKQVEIRRLSALAWLEFSGGAGRFAAATVMQAAKSSAERALV